MYSEKEARKILKERLKYYLKQKKEAGYLLEKKEAVLETEGKTYQYQGTLVFYKEQNKYKMTRKK